jgi:hypothetical protein
VNDLDDNAEWPEQKVSGLFYFFAWGFFCFLALGLIAAFLCYAFWMLEILIFVLGV